MRIRDGAQLPTHGLGAAHQLVGLRPAQPAPGREQRHGLEDIRLACAVLAGQNHRPRRKIERQGMIIPKVGEAQPGNVNLGYGLPAGCLGDQGEANAGAL